MIIKKELFDFNEIVLKKGNNYKTQKNISKSIHSSKKYVNMKYKIWNINYKIDGKITKIIHFEDFFSSTSE